MKLDALDHPKLHDLAARLGISRPTAIGHLELLWAFTARYAADGDVGRRPVGAIARACDWMGDPKTFVDALVASGWVDEGDPMTIHDWSDHRPRWVASKVVRAARKTNEPTVAPTTVPTVVGAVVPTAEATPSLVKSSQAKPSQEKEARDRAADPLFESLADACGWDWRKGLGKAARGELNAALADLRQMGATPEDVSQRAAAYRKRFGADISLTPSALAKHWPSLGSEPKPAARPVDPKLAAQVAATEKALAGRAAALSAPVSEDAKAKAASFIADLAAKKAMPR